MRSCARAARSPATRRGASASDRRRLPADTRPRASRFPRHPGRRMNAREPARNGLESKHERAARTTRTDGRARRRFSRFGRRAARVPADDAGRAATTVRGAGAGRPDGSRDRRRAAGRGRGSGDRRDPERTLLRLRDRRLGARGARGRLAHDGVGSERRPLRRWAVGVHRRGSCRRLGQRSARPAGARIVRVRHRMPDGARHRAGRGALPRPAAGGLGCEPRRLDGRAARARARRRESPRDGEPRAAAARPRRAGDRRRGRARTHARRRAARRARVGGWADDRVRAGRRGQHGRVRPLRRDRGRRRGRRRVAARRRRVRALGCDRPVARAPPRGRRARRLVGDGRTQVAERAVRLRHRALRAPGGAPRGDERSGRVFDPGRRRRRSRPGRLDARVLAPGARLHGLRGDSVARTFGDRRDRRAVLRGRRTVRARDRCAPRRGDRERRRAEPGAVPLRHRRANRRGVAGGAAGRRGVDERHDVGRAQAIRLSVSNWQTGDDEIDLAVAAFREAVYAGQAPAR